MTLPITRLLIRKILENANQYQWSLQGLGMFRLYLSEQVRLHVWDTRFAVPNVSTLHTHPWDFESVIICGKMENKIYSREYKSQKTKGTFYMSQKILCGPGGHLEGAPESCTLWEGPTTATYGPGDRYHERAEIIHESIPEDGTITIVTRYFRQDRDHAYVFWPVGEEWVSAEPRPATVDEVREMKLLALSMIDSEIKQIEDRLKIPGASFHFRRPR